MISNTVVLFFIADQVMGLCIVLKEELRLKNIGFYIANTDCFFNFQVMFDFKQ